jgi:hypothetical protein
LEFGAITKLEVTVSVPLDGFPGLTDISVPYDTFTVPPEAHNVHIPVFVGTKDPLNSPYEPPEWYVYTVVYKDNNGGYKDHDFGFF